MLGVLAGLAIGVAFKQQHPLALPLTWRAGAVRAVLGNVVLLTLFESVALLQRRFGVVARFIKYALVPLFIIHIGPALFIRLGI